MPAIEREGQVRVEIGSSVCDRYTGTCGRIVDILNDEVLIEPTTIRKKDKEYLETIEPPIRVKKVNLAPDHFRRYEREERNVVETGNPIISPVKTEDIIALHEQGLPPGEIATKLGTTYIIVYGRLLRAGLTPHPAPPPLIPTEDIVALHKEGLSPPEIGARLNVSSYLIHARLRRAGFKPNPPPLWEEAKERSREIVELHEEGLSPKQVAERLGLSTGLVYKRLREERLVPYPTAEEARNTLEALDEIVRLAKQDMPRYEIARRIGSTWPLVAETLEKSSVKPIWPACGELTTWASDLLPIIAEIREAYPDTEPIMSRVDQLEKELVAISGATGKVERELYFETGIKADEERWCVAPISHAADESLKDMDALRGCIRQLDVAELPKKLEQAETCIHSITDRARGAFAGAVPLHSSKIGGQDMEQRGLEPRTERAVNNPVTDEKFTSQVADYVAAIGVEEITPKDIEDLMWLKEYEDGPRLATYLKTPKGQYFYMEALRLARKALRPEVEELKQREVA